MEKLHSLLCELNIVSSDINNLKTALQLIEHSNEAGEEEMRAILNMTILYLATVVSAIDCNVDLLDSYLLEKRHKDSSNIPS